MIRHSELPPDLILNLEIFRIEHIQFIYNPLQNIYHSSLY